MTETHRWPYILFLIVTIVWGAAAFVPHLKRSDFTVDVGAGTVRLNPGLSKSAVERLLGRKLPESPTRLKDYTQSTFAASSRVAYVLTFHKGKLDSVHSPEEVGYASRLTARWRGRRSGRR